MALGGGEGAAGAVARSEGLSGGIPMVTNGQGGQAEWLDQALRKLEQLNEAEERRTREGLIEAEVKLRLAQELQRRAEIPKRSQMTAAEKSSYIRTFGLSKYQELPWS
jgi:hypothetical protein